MATTTPNFGWAVPTSSDLVKNGATAIETLGDAIDASMVDLKGGTTGQVLSKASNTDMDFTWATPSAGSTNVAGKNGVLNSAFNVWQRGTSISFAASGSPYGPDRWNVFSGNTGTCSRQATGDTTNLPNIQYAARVQRTAGVTATTAFEFGQAFETINSIPFVGKTVTLSFYIRKGADFSGSTLNAQVLSGTGTDQNPISGSYTGQATVLNSNISASLTTTWQRITITGTVATSATELTVRFYWVPSGTAGAADYYEVTGVQLEIASSASAYSPNTSTYQAELAACQRYYNRFTAPQAYSHFAQGWAINTDNAIVYFNLPVEMRTVPTAIDYASVNIGDSVNPQITPSTITFTADNNNTKAIGCTGTKSAGGMTQYRNYQFLAAGTTAAYIGFSAEL